MPTWLKVVLGILIGSVVICGGVVGACALLAKGAYEKTKSTMADADAYGKSHTDAQVLQEGLARAKKCGASDAMCQAAAGMFYGVALNGSQSTPEFCEGIPQSGDVQATNAWEAAKCKSLGYPNDSQCLQLVRQVPIHCYKTGQGHVAKDDGKNAADDDADDGKDDQEPDDNDQAPDQAQKPAK